MKGNVIMVDYRLKGNQRVFPWQILKKAPRVKTATNQTFLFLSAFKFIIEFHHCFRNSSPAGWRLKQINPTKEQYLVIEIARAFEYKRNSLSRMSGSFFLALIASSFISGSPISLRSPKINFHLVCLPCGLYSIVQTNQHYINLFSVTKKYPRKEND